MILTRELSSYIGWHDFWWIRIYETERRLDLLNGLKAKYGQRIEEIQEYQKKQQEKLNKLQKYEEIFEASREELKKAEKKLEVACSRLSEIRKEYSHQLEKKVIQGLKDLNFLDDSLPSRFPEEAVLQRMVMMKSSMKFPQIREKVWSPLVKSYPAVSFQNYACPEGNPGRSWQIETLIFDE